MYKNSFNRLELKEEQSLNEEWSKALYQIPE